MKITVNEIAAAVGGRLLCGNGETIVEHISLDSRKMAGRDLFVPVIGAKTDGHQYMAGAKAAGAAAAYTSEHETGDADFPLIRVEDTVKALQQLGRYVRSRLTMPFIGITGSVGKTSTREMVTAALSAGLKVTGTAGNSNGQLGVPVTLCELEEDAGVAVMEMGMSEPGEMARIADIARVHIGIMTNIGVSHIENLGSRENIRDEKLHIADHMGREDLMILNGDDPLLAPLAGTLPCRTALYGLGEGCDYRAEEVRQQDGRIYFTLTAPGRQIPVKLQVPGLHNVRNALAACVAADALGVDLTGAAEKLAAYHGYARRLQTVPMDGFTVIDDSYNASPDSMKAALQVLSAAPCGGRRIAVLADMLELGPDSPVYHAEVGKYAGEVRPDMIVTVGPLAKQIGAAAEASGVKVSCLDSNEEASAALQGYLKAGDLVLLKGSNGMHLGEILEKLKAIHL